MNVKKIVFAGLFIALEVIFTRFLSIQTPIIRIGFTFIPTALSAVLLGPLFAGITAGLADIIGMVLFSGGAAYFPGFTLSAFLSGAIYGLFLYRKSVRFWRVCMAVLIITVVVNLGLDTLWLWMLTGKGILGLLPARFIKSVIMFPIQVILIQVVWKSLAVSLRLEPSHHFPNGFR
ncbi:folate family ECF transporter S component [Weizmannia coagulans]|jgi:ECF transporter S component (folate family)|uniref:Folate family ECF transporter S component n=1 Tax=Heyndrickxia faecalis TaxID=2824910 RepID=A0ABV3NNA5_9BACI|nr:MULTISPECIES: folate family ECF transporter S component [Heyndrickxia]NWN93219.1 folate family ECF transporter S component [Bacillus sp. (in: firmicutes)]ATW82294.1 folate family ECF transporter S component [Heyndrickxia coagulans]AVD57045.1 folate family ECF transporter S component [Heyndrickxia coagulans]AWP37986.1 folate family ECF transporter S component [Heyndrickxia coagulans]KGB29181.1 folate transporter [Heyndrickxia coagulans]